MTQDDTTALAEAIGTLIQLTHKKNVEAAELQVQAIGRLIYDIDQKAFKRGYEARQAELTANLRNVAEAWREVRY